MGCSCTTMACTDETQKTFKCEEFEEYLLIEDVGTSSVDPEPEQTTEPHCKDRIRTEGSLDSGYDGKLSRTASPGEVKPNGIAQEPEAEQDCQEPEVLVLMSMAFGKSSTTQSKPCID